MALHANHIQEHCKISATGLDKSLNGIFNTTILVTGGTGFIGKWICEAVSYLNEQQAANIKLYLLSRDAEAFRNTVPHLSSKSFVHLIEQDVKNVGEFPADVTHIIHAAATPDRREHASQPLRVIETIYKGTVNVLNAAVRLPILEKIVYLSSNHIYGSSYTNKPITENEQGTLDSNAVASAYAEAKRLAEVVCAVFRNQQRLPLISVRPFTFIGPYQDIEKPWVVNNFLRDALLGGPIRVLGDPNNVRSFLYGSDAAFWMLSLLGSKDSSGVYNLGSWEEVSVKELAEKIVNHFPNKIDITYRDLSNEHQLNYTIPDMSRLKKTVAVKDFIKLDEAIKYTIDWYKTQVKW